MYDKRKVGNMALLMAVALGMGSEPPQSDPVFSGRPALPPKREERPPAGCKTYWFKANGEFSSERMLKSDTVFECFAINDCNAIRKFKRWLSSHGG